MFVKFLSNREIYCLSTVFQALYVTTQFMITLKYPRKCVRATLFLDVTGASRCRVRNYQ